MKYYFVALPLKLTEEYIYKYSEEIVLGTRVIVTFQTKTQTGITYKIAKEIDDKIKYKEIIEIIDDKPILNDEQLRLADWITSYYHSTIGQVIFSMIPTALNVTIQQEIRKIKNGICKDSDGSAEIILNNISTLHWQPIQEVKDSIKVRRKQFWLERLEEEGLVEIKRTFDQKIKKKVANYILLNKVKELPKLTEKQYSSYQLIQSKGKEFPLAEIAKEISYSVVKALRLKGLLRIEPREIEDEFNQLPKVILIPKIIALTDEQNQVIKTVNQILNQKKFESFLLYGITGSGKTEVYIQLIKTTIKTQRNAMLLVPEISLTPQLLSKFYSIFKDEIAVLHSRLNERERWYQWKRIYKQEVKIVIGVRSAVFAPLKDIGLIIIDEEHETTYKQEKNPHYHARDVAVVRAKINNAVVVLGSATPSLESWQNVHEEKYGFTKIINRPYEASLPSVQLIDMRAQKQQKLLISRPLAEQIEKALQRKEQIILFHNRRGFSSFVQCTQCGYVFQCPNCEISMNFHSYDSSLKCHYCGYSRPIPRNCPECNSYLFNFGASGTQQVENQIKEMFPTAKVLRMDSDTTTKKDSFTSMFERMKNGHVDILLGTQMITKGLDFENVTLVGIVSADTILNFPDFRSAEKTFQLITQVAGRSGRGRKSGKVVIQTYNPDHYVIETAQKQDFVAFAKQELMFRKIMHYPPFWKLARVMFSDKNEVYLKEKLTQFQKVIEPLKIYFLENELIVLGPVEAPLLKVNNKYRHHIILKAKNVTVLHQAVNFIKTKWKNSSIKMMIDIDPFNLL